MPRHRCTRGSGACSLHLWLWDVSKAASCKADAAKHSSGQDATGGHDAQAGFAHSVCQSLQLLLGTGSCLWVHAAACSPSGLLQLRHIFGEANLGEGWGCAAAV